MSSTTCHTPLSDARYIGTITDVVQIWKLLQHGEPVVFPKGLNGEPEAGHFSFPELPLWDVVGKLAGGPPPIEVIIEDVEHESMPFISPSPASLAPTSHPGTLG